MAGARYTRAGEKRWFGEAPHMGAGMVFRPGKVYPPRIGDEVVVEVRLTTATVDRIVLE